MREQARLGLGLIGIGREWGYVKSAVPRMDLVLDLLETALELGITFFDTAPSYGSSEERLGQFLRSLEPSCLQPLTIATKFGEHWNTDHSMVYVDHSYDSLCRSVDYSLKRLPKIDIIQLHKARSGLLHDVAVKKALEYARNVGIRSIGASASDLATAVAAIENDAISAVQFPFNQTRTDLDAVFHAARLYRKQLIINRPFAEGKLVADVDRNGGTRQTEAFRFILQRHFDGVILTGTKSTIHLRENAEAFSKALREVEPL